MAEIQNPNLMGLATNLSNKNKWIAYLPLENILGKKYGDIELHLKSFSLPQLVMGSTNVAYKGYQKEIPTKVLNEDTKELTLSYFIDENWKNYKALYAWISAPEGTVNPIVDEDASGKLQPDLYINLRIYLLDNYKKKVIQFVFENCWIKMFTDLLLDVADSGEIEHSFTFCYDRYRIEDVATYATNN